MSLNKVMIIGNLGDNPNIYTTNSGKEIARLRVATNQRFIDKSGQYQERTQWHNVVIFAQGIIDKVVKPYLSKGKQIYVEGEIHSDTYTDKDGVERHGTDIVTDSLFLTGNKPKSE